MSWDRTREFGVSPGEQEELSRSHRLRCTNRVLGPTRSFDGTIVSPPRVVRAKTDIRDRVSARRRYPLSSRPDGAERSLVGPVGCANRDRCRAARDREEKRNERYARGRRGSPKQLRSITTRKRNRKYHSSYISESPPGSITIESSHRSRAAVMIYLILAVGCYRSGRPLQGDPIDEGPLHPVVREEACGTRRPFGSG